MIIIVFCVTRPVQETTTPNPGASFIQVKGNDLIVILCEVFLLGSYGIHLMVHVLELCVFAGR